jgi:hypothetical protein
MKHLYICSFHSFGPEYVKVFLKSSVFAFGICNFSLTTFRREYGFLSDKYWILFFKYIGASFFRHFETKKYLNLESRQLFYSGYILPLIDYCCVVWGNCSNEGLNRIPDKYWILFFKYIGASFFRHFETRRYL